MVNPVRNRNEKGGRRTQKARPPFLSPGPGAAVSGRMEPGPDCSAPPGGPSAPIKNRLPD